MKNDIFIKNWLKIVFGIALLFILYLFALNGRYTKWGQMGFFDKWTGEGYIMGSDEIPLVKNGEILTD